MQRSRKGLLMDATRAVRQAGVEAVQPPWNTRRSSPAPCAATVRSEPSPSVGLEGVGLSFMAVAPGERPLSCSSSSEVLGRGRASACRSRLEGRVRKARRGGRSQGPWGSSFSSSKRRARRTLPWAVKSYRASGHGRLFRRRC